MEMVMTNSHADPLQFCWRMVPWFKIKQMQIEAETIATLLENFRSQYFRDQNGKHEQRLRQRYHDTKEIDLRTACLKATMRKWTVHGQSGYTSCVQREQFW